jgi:hypothetical protein
VENPSTEELGDAQEVALLAPHRGVHAGTPDRIARAVPEQVSEIGRDRRHDSARIEYEASARRPARPGDDALYDDQITVGNEWRLAFHRRDGGHRFRPTSVVRRSRP